jgi:hypothetical protein
LRCQSKRPFASESCEIGSGACSDCPDLLQKADGGICRELGGESHGLSDHCTSQIRIILMRIRLVSSVASVSIECSSITNIALNNRHRLFGEESESASSKPHTAVRLPSPLTKRLCDAGQRRSLVPPTHFVGRYRGLSIVCDLSHTICSLARRRNPDVFSGLHRSIDRRCRSRTVDGMAVQLIEVMGILRE